MRRGLIKIKDFRLQSKCVGIKFLDVSKKSSPIISVKGAVQTCKDEVLSRA